MPDRFRVASPEEAVEGESRFEIRAGAAIEGGDVFVKVP